MTKHKLPKGFQASGIHSGVKKKRKDLSLVYSKTPCKVAALFTKNAVKAAPVLLAEEELAKDCHIHAVVINSGNANCMTGRRGLKDAGRIVSETRKLLGASKGTVLTSSTGIIGEFLPMKTILKGLPKLVKKLSRDGLDDAAQGIMTTDRFAKVSVRTFEMAGKKITISGFTKGAGMIKPDMATMLGYVMTDANVSEKALKKALFECNSSSFNAITVDGDMSTNDTVMLLANGKSGNKLILEKDKSFNTFKGNLKAVCVDLAKMIVEDGEGATKFIEVSVKGAHSKRDAKRVADAIGNSLLVKCAVLGGDPNWGRIASSAGSSGVKFDPDRMEIKLDGVTFFKVGRKAAFVDRKKSKVFKKKSVKIEVDLHAGKSEAVVYSCDISKKYITLNSYYTT
ncbi:MAG: bifunctional glutamate N-acetyltransferase/amino-acid acetyltransferase ArgJ [Candidatus Omnitrophica bacterium]|nr:bifunctional glutamate N-acetyltransferase/amino-acid acetyltransferase ArgJ [Candidatus Omnitrophota bacterium]